MWVNLHHMLKCPLQFLHEWLKWEGIPYFANTSFTNKLLSNFPCVNPNLLSWNLQLYPAARHYLSPHRTRPFFILYINYIYIYILYINPSSFSITLYIASFRFIHNFLCLILDTFTQMGTKNEQISICHIPKTSRMSHPLQLFSRHLLRVNHTLLRTSSF